MSWNYRIIKHYDRHPLHEKRPNEFPEFVEFYSIHEVYYNPDGSVRNWTKNAMDLSADSVEELKEMLTAIRGALRKPILEESKDGR